MSTQESLFTSQFIQFLEMDRSSCTDSIYQWLVNNYPNIRVQAIGDFPEILWFSASRCNPPSEADNASVNEQIMILNRAMIISWQIVHGSVLPLFEMKGWTRG